MIAFFGLVDEDIPAIAIFPESFILQRWSGDWLSQPSVDWVELRVAKITS